MRVPTSEELSGLSGRITAKEGEQLMYLSSQLPLGAYVQEIGSFKGKSTCYLAAGLVKANNTNGRVHAVDLWTLGNTNSAKYHTQETFDIFNYQIKKLELENIIIPYMNTSIKAAKKHSKPIDMLFIDGNHKYNSVYTDWKAWKVFLKNGSIIAFHDHTPRWNGVMRVVDEEVLEKYSVKDVGQVDSLWWATFLG